ncbi:MAG: peptidoglycan-binding protein [Eubacteriales bacterium]
MAEPIIPQYITVHLGLPSDDSAPNVTVPFMDYLKNVASSEIYPTWPESSLRANIYAQISFALNRIYTEWYPSRGYNFDITSTTQFDQKYIPNREYFDTTSVIVEELFNDYVIRQGKIQPLFTQYCNGTTSKCDGLSQWGTVDLAEQGLTPYEILQYYYGDDIGIVFNAPTGDNLPSYPGYAIRLGAIGEEVRTIQRQLNRIARNYPAIATVEITGTYEQLTESSIREFQRIFNLSPDGVVGSATWYKLKSIYTAVKGLGELESEGLALSEVDRAFAKVLKFGGSGLQISVLQYYLAVISYFDNRIPQVNINGTFDQATLDGVVAFQQIYGLNPDGIVGRLTWDKIRLVYNQTLASLPANQPGRDDLYPDRYLSLGQSGAEVRQVQELLNLAATRFDYLPTVTVDGNFGPATQKAVMALQENNGLLPSGVVGPITWMTLLRLIDN